MRWMAFFLLLLVGCEHKPDKIRIAINPWAGYEFLFLAEKKGFFDEFDLPIELVQVASLSDAQSVYINNNVEGLASTLIEAIQATPLGGKPLKVVIIADYSNGSDIIIGARGSSISELQGKRVGVEVGALGLFLLSRALENVGLTLDDISLVNINQSEIVNLMLSGQIDAAVTYSPYTISLARHQSFDTLFSSAEIPKEVVDVISVSNEVLEVYPDFAPKLQKVWQRALTYYEQHPEESMNIMAQRQRVHVDEFSSSLEGIQMLSIDEQLRLLSSSNEVLNTAKRICSLLVDLGSIEDSCEHTSTLFYSPVTKHLDTEYRNDK